MPTSATGTRRRPRARHGAFTLIEVLVVVAIAGILVAVAAINLFPSDRQVARERANGVALAVEHARDAAWFGGLPTAVSFEESRVREWKLAGSAWQPAIDTTISEIRIAALSADGQPLAPDARLVFLSDGFGTPFRIAVEVRGQSWAVEGDAAGAVKVIEP